MRHVSVKQRMSTGLETKHITLTTSAPLSIAGELVPFWAIYFILLLQVISTCKENLRQYNSCPAALWYTVVLFCVHMTSNGNIGVKAKHNVPLVYNLPL